MMNFFDQLKEKINKNIKPEKITLIDNSHIHSKHKFFDAKKYHLKIIIKSEKLKKMSKIDSHKLIYSTLEADMNEKIHALEIEIN